MKNFLKKNNFFFGKSLLKNFSEKTYRVPLVSTFPNYRLPLLPPVNSISISYPKKPPPPRPKS